MIDKIYDIFKGKTAMPIGKYKNSAVMILLLEEAGETFVIFEERAHTLRSQPGDICLPGGRIDEGETPKEAAIRETMEELNLNREDIEYIGEMDYYISPYSVVMYPFVSRLKVKEINPSKDEVDHIIKVPLSFLMNTQPLYYSMEIGPTNQEGFPFHLIKGGKDYKFRKGTLDEYFYVYEDHVIWGFTAIVIKSFIDNLTLI